MGQKAYSSVHCRYWHVHKAIFEFSCLLIRNTARFVIRMQRPTERNLSREFRDSSLSLRPSVLRNSLSHFPSAKPLVTGPTPTSSPTASTPRISTAHFLVCLVWPTSFPTRLTRPAGSSSVAGWPRPCSAIMQCEPARDCDSAQQRFLPDARPPVLRNALSHFPSAKPLVTGPTPTSSPTAPTTRMSTAHFLVCLVWPTSFPTRLTRPAGSSSVAGWPRPCSAIMQCEPARDCDSAQQRFLPDARPPVLRRHSASQQSPEGLRLLRARSVWSCR